MRLSHIARAIVVSLLLSSCAHPFKTYSGPRKSNIDVATIRTESEGSVGEQLFNSLLGINNDRRVAIRTVNGQEVKYSWIEVPVGECTLGLSFEDGAMVRSKGHINLKFETQPGHSYIVGGFSKNNWTWAASVVDSNDRKVVAEGTGELYALEEHR